MLHVNGHTYIAVAVVQYVISVRQINKVISFECKYVHFIKNRDKKE